MNNHVWTDLCLLRCGYNCHCNHDTVTPSLLCSLKWSWSTFASVHLRKEEGQFSFKPKRFLLCFVLLLSTLRIMMLDWNHKYCSNGFYWYHSLISSPDCPQSYQHFSHSTMTEKCVPLNLDLTCLRVNSSLEDSLSVAASVLSLVKVKIWRHVPVIFTELHISECPA